MDDHERGRRPAYKSRIERMIGEFLDSQHIPFMYEKPTAVMDRGQCKLWYPDYSLQCGPIIEYFGIVGDPSYQDRTRHKLSVYKANQYDVIPLYPVDIVSGWPENLLRQIEGVLKQRISGIRYIPPSFPQKPGASR